MHMDKVSVWRVLRMLMADQKRTRVVTCSTLLERYRVNFVEGFVKIDESCIWIIMVQKIKRKAWNGRKHGGSPPPPKFKIRLLLELLYFQFYGCNFLFHQDNAPVHKPLVAMATIQILDSKFWTFIFLIWPPVSYQFPKLKEYLRGVIASPNDWFEE